MKNELRALCEAGYMPLKDYINMVTKDTIFTYIGIDLGTEDKTTYWIYDPRTDKHYEVSKEKYDEVMKNVKSS